MRLVVAPHVDDDVLGAGGILDADTVTFFCGVDEMHVVSAEERAREATAVYRDTGGTFWWPYKNFECRLIEPPGPEMVHQYRTDRVVNRFDRDLVSLITDLEWVIRSFMPDEVILPWPSYNQDHRAVYEAGLVATRPHDKNHFVKRVLLYEQPQDFYDWAHGAKFSPNLFRQIDIETKIRRYELMKSQVRAHRSPDMLRALAEVRGAAANVPYAEAFQIIRWVE